MVLDPVANFEPSSSLSFDSARRLAPPLVGSTFLPPVNFHAATDLNLVFPPPPAVPLPGDLRRNGENKRDSSMMVSSELRSKERLESGEQSDVYRVQSDGLTPCLGGDSDDNDLSGRSDEVQCEDVVGNQVIDVFGSI